MNEWTLLKKRSGSLTVKRISFLFFLRLHRLRFTAMEASERATTIPTEEDAPQTKTCEFSVCLFTSQSTVMSWPLCPHMHTSEFYKLRKKNKITCTSYLLLCDFLSYQLVPDRGPKKIIKVNWYNSVSHFLKQYLFLNIYSESDDKY